MFRTAFFINMDKKRVAIQGIKGCFHEQAAYMFYEKISDLKPEIVECSSFENLYVSMSEGKADAAVKPLMTDLNILGEYEAAV